MMMSILFFRVVAINMPFKDNQYLNFVFLQNLGLYF